MDKELKANTTLSHYRIVSKLGAGGMGEVYLAQDTRLDRKVALKILPAELASHRDRMERFVREAKSAAALNHPNIATIHEIGESEGVNFIAMEFIDGVTLREKIHRERTELRRLLRHLQHVAEGLAKAHAAGIVHRDLKPDNIMITHDGHAKILDFGLAKLIETSGPGPEQSEGGEAPTAVMHQHSVPGMIMGTIGYMSPEQAQAKSVDQRSDIFSFGCILYETATGRKPFAGDSIVDTLHKVIHDPAPAITAFNPSASPELQRVIRKCLAKEPKKRYQTIRDTVNDLEELLEEMKGVSDIERSVAPSTGASSSSTSGITNADLTALSTASVTHPPASSAEYIFSGVKEHKFAAAVVLLVLIVGVAVGLSLYLSAGTTAAAIESIAVMPFVNESGNADVEYLSDGMTETLINSLSQIPNLSVKARSSVFRYKGKEIDPKKIAAELNVQAILTGRVVLRGDQLTLNLELIDAQTENILWGNRYERKSSELVALQSEIARDVSNKLKTKLSGADAAKIGKSYTSNPDAYQLYLKGRFSWNKRTPESLKQAIGFYEQAIEKDPNYALAFSGLAETYVLFSFYGVAPAKESMPKAKAAIDRALAIDDLLAEAHAARGKYLAFFEFDRSGSEREFRRGIELNPNYATAYQWLGLDFLVLTRRFDEGIRELRRAGEIDPLSPVIGSDTASALGYAGRFDEAIDQARRTLELEPGFSYAHTFLGYALDGKGQFAEAISEYEKAISLSDDGYSRAMLIRALIRAGRRSEAERQMEALRTFASKSYVPNFCFAIAYTALGDKEAAIAMLEKDVEERSSYVVTIGIELALNELRDEPRFKALLKRLNLPQ